MRDVAESVLAWQRKGLGVALAFVTRTVDSSPRAVGSVMAVSADGDIAGSVSAGCAEGMVVREAIAVIESGEASLVTMRAADPGTPDAAWAGGAPCGGDIDVFVQPFDPEVHAFMMERAAAGEPFAYLAVLDEDCPLAGACAVVSDQGSAAAWMDANIASEALDCVGWNAPAEGTGAPLRHGKSIYHDENSLAAPAGNGGTQAGVFDIAGMHVFACRYDARPQLVCVGAVHIASCLAPMAKAAGYDVRIIDPRRAFLDGGAFIGADQLIHAWPQEAIPNLHLSHASAVCVLTHDPKIDVPALAEALKTDAFYIGCLGSAKTLRKRCAALVDEGVDPAQLSRIYAPIGLYIGGKDPADIAVSILAQIQAVRFGRIGHGAEMPGHTLDSFIVEEAAANAAGHVDAEPIKEDGEPMYEGVSSVQADGAKGARQCA
jgi:xanthine dehydrogenase accessory factor